MEVTYKVDKEGDNSEILFSKLTKGELDNIRVILRTFATYQLSSEWKDKLSLDSLITAMYAKD